MRGVRAIVRVDIRGGQRLAEVVLGEKREARGEKKTSEAEKSEKKTKAKTQEGKNQASCHLQCIIVPSDALAS